MVDLYAHCKRVLYKRFLFPEMPAPEDIHESLHGIIAFSGISRWLWRLYGLAWIGCLVYGVYLLGQTHFTPRRAFVDGIGGAIFFVLYLWLIWIHPAERHRRPRSQRYVSWLLFAILIALTVGFGLIDNPAWLWFFVCVSVVAGLIFSLRTALFAVVGVTLLCGICGMLSIGWVQTIPLVLVVKCLGIITIGLSALVEALSQVQRQRQSLVHLAVTEERLRIARDLHDLLGRNLSVIILKSALAERLLLTDPTHAADEILAVEHVARETLREVRHAITGYRRPTLPGELDGARQILEAADIKVTLKNDAGVLPPDGANALAWVVREGATNILRHSRASQCLLTLTRTANTVSFEMVNNGYQQNGAAIIHGNGLTGLSERVAELGGSLEAKAVNWEHQQGFRLWAVFPVCEDAISQEEE